ncbi:MAG: hypothetical protein IJQ94_05535 [Bacteroidales bacterium]|nr:hypothetical protein [Bacteroidales bacterium]
MDNFLEVIITIAMVALFLFPSLLKSAKEVNKKPATRANPDTENEKPKKRSVLHKNASEIPKQEEYFTYETLDVDSMSTMTQAENFSNSETQQLVNKAEENTLLSLEDDEVLKGIVYAEILKRKF